MFGRPGNGRMLGRKLSGWERFKGGSLVKLANMLAVTRKRAHISVVEIDLVERATRSFSPGILRDIILLS